MRTAFRKVDARGTGKVSESIFIECAGGRVTLIFYNSKISREGFRLALSEFGIQLTAQECDLLLRRFFNLTVVRRRFSTSFS